MTRWLRWRLRRAVRDIATVDLVLADIEEAHPTAVTDHAAMRHRSKMERLALDERAQPGSSTSVAMPRGLDASLGWDQASGHVWRS